VTFDDILRPIERESFFLNHWARTPLLIKGLAEKFSSFPSSEALPGLLAGILKNGKWSDSINLFAEATGVSRSGEIIRLKSVPFSMYSQLYNAGFSLCFRDVSIGNKVLESLVSDCDALSDRKASAIVTSYLTPPHCNGYVHYDYQHVFFLQVEGSKFWRISERPGIECPIENLAYGSISQAFLNGLRQKGYEISIPSDSGSLDLLLEQGDVLYLPPGYYHVAHTREKYSFHYTLTLESSTFWDSVKIAFRNELLKNHAEFNRDLRTMPLEERLEFYSCQLETLRAALNALTPGDLEALIRNASR
jgi:ribosomal protein L16 Arg81 hydroxylase